MITSYFVGLDVSGNDWFEFYSQINDVLSGLDFVMQNFYTLYLTLCYLDKFIDRKNVVLELRDLAEKIFMRNMVVDYFETRDSFIIYLTSSDWNCLSKEFERYDNLFGSDVFENTLEFVPHITLARVKKFENLGKILSELNLCLAKFEAELSSLSFDMVKLYKVNSRINPELQVVVD